MLKNNSYVKLFVLTLSVIISIIFFSCRVDSENEDSNNDNNGNADFTNHIPVGTHPRLWLTKERLDYFKNAISSNTPEWQELLAQCNALTDNDPENDPYGVDNSPQMGTAPLALVYLLTGDSKYADKAMELMDRTPASIFDSSGETIYGDPDHHSFEYFGLAYDWLYDYQRMSEGKREEYRKKMLSISDSFWQSYGLNASGSDSDANLLSGLIHLVLGTAMFGENDRAREIIDRGWKGWDEGYGSEMKISNLDIVRKSFGGVYPTGFSYFTGTDILGISGYWMSFLTAYEYDIGKSGPKLSKFWANLARSFIHLTEPERAYIYHNGSWQDPNRISDQAWFYQFIQIASFFNRLYNNSDEAALLRGYAGKIQLYRNGWFTEFFYDNDKNLIKDPFSGILPLIRFAKSPDFLLFRNNWTGNATWGVFVGDGYIPLDHQNPDQGHFSLWKGDGYLTKGARTYDGMLHGEFFNSLSIQNNCSYNDESCSGTSIFNSEKSAFISRHRINLSGHLFAYSMLEADGQWNDSPSQWNAVANVQTYRRHFFWMDDYVILLDRVRTKEPGWVKYRIRALTEPSVNNSTGTISQLSANGKYKLLHRTIFPSGVNISKLNENILWKDVPDWVVDYNERHWQSVIKFSPRTSLNLLNIIQMGYSSLNTFDRIEKISDNGNIGVRLGDLVIVFNSLENLRMQCSYIIQVNGESLVHFITDLESGQYTITINGKKRTDLTVSTEDNTAYFETGNNSGVLSVSINKN